MQTLEWMKPKWISWINHHLHASLPNFSHFTYGNVVLLLVTNVLFSTSVSGAAHNWWRINTLDCQSINLVRDIQSGRLPIHPACRKYGHQSAPNSVSALLCAQKIVPARHTAHPKCGALVSYIIWYSSIIFHLSFGGCPSHAYLQLVPAQNDDGQKGGHLPCGRRSYLSHSGRGRFQGNVWGS